METVNCNNCKHNKGTWCTKGHWDDEKGKPETCKEYKFVSSDSKEEKQRFVKLATIYGISFVLVVVILFLIFK